MYKWRGELPRQGFDSPQVHHFGKVKVSASPASLRGAGSAAKLNGNLKEKINFWFCIYKRKFFIN